MGTRSVTNLFLASSLTNQQPPIHTTHPPTKKSKRGDNPVPTDPSLKCSHQGTTNRDAIEETFLRGRHTLTDEKHSPLGNCLPLLGIGQSVKRRLQGLDHLPKRRAEPVREKDRSSTNLLARQTNLFLVRLRNTNSVCHISKSQLTLPHKSPISPERDYG